MMFPVDGRVCAVGLRDPPHNQHGNVIWCLIEVSALLGCVTLFTLNLTMRTIDSRVCAVVLREPSHTQPHDAYC